jgi:uncharacterized protein (TIGR02147 family)
MKTTEHVKSVEAAQLLRVELAERKQRNPNYSLRAFAQSLGISPSQLSQLISGKRNFTVDVLGQVSKALALSPEQERQLVARTLVPRTLAREERAKRQLAEDEFKLISDWYHYAILSLGKVKNAKADAFWIADRLGISVAEARGALDRLKRLDLIDDSKTLRQKEKPLNISSATPSRAIQAYHQNILNMAQARLSDTPIEKRDYSAMTFAADATRIPQARKMIEEFQDQLVDYLQTPHSKEVFIIACQLFSLERNTK